MSDPEQAYKAPQNIADHPAWARLNGQFGYYDRKAIMYQRRFKHIKLVVIAVSAGIPIIISQPFGPGYDGAARFIIAFCGAVIAMLEGLLLLNQYGSLWTKYRGTAEDLNRERWLLLSQVGDYADQGLDQAMRKLAIRVESILDTERKDWREKQQSMQATLAKAQGSVPGNLDEIARHPEVGVGATVHLNTAKVPALAPS